jgi:surfeit locus 1 family protein
MNMLDRPIGPRFDFEWRTSLLTAILLPVLVFLGFWQLQRADEKIELAHSWELRRQQPRAMLADLEAQPPGLLAYAPVALSGTIVPDKYFLLDNRIHRGQFGYEVLSLFELQGEDMTVLLNRGWIAGDPARLTLPELPPLVGELAIAGHVYVAPGRPFLLAEQELEPGWPKRIQAVEMIKLSPLAQATTSKRVFPYPVRIDEAQPGALTVDWKIMNVSPSKHTGYAVQWFTMAAALFVVYLLHSSNLWQLIARSGRKSD